MPIVTNNSINNSVLANDFAVSAGNITLPNTNSGGTNGVIKVGGNNFIHNGGTGNTSVGSLAGRTSNSGGHNTAVGTSALAANTGDADNTAVGYQALQSLNDSGSQCVAVGSGALKTATAMPNGSCVAVGYSALGAFTGASGGGSVAIGRVALSASVDDSHNTAVGWVALSGMNGGSENTAIGGASFSQGSFSGSGNIGIGYNSGTSASGSSSNNIYIGSVGAAESNTIRIGTQGSGARQQNVAFMAGIAGVTVSNSAAVLIDTTTGQLGTVASSERYKDNIEDMEDASSPLMEMRPVIFTYKSDPAKLTQYGLIAEEVHELMPDIVVYNKEGQPETVQYHILPSLLLNELQKLSKKVHEQSQELRELKHTVKQLKRG